MVWHPVIVVVIDAVVGLHIHGLALYPSRVHGKWIVIVHSCGIILLVVVVTTNMALSPPTMAAVGNDPMVECFLSFLLVAKRSKEGTRMFVSEFLHPPIQGQRR